MAGPGIANYRSVLSDESARSDSDFVVLQAVQNLAVNRGTALLQTDNPPYAMVDGIPRAPLRRDLFAFACVNNVDLRDWEDVARLRAALWLRDSA